MNSLNIWSNIPGQWYKASTEPDAQKAAGNEAKAGAGQMLVKEIKSVDELLRFFAELCQKADVWNSVRFHTHGSPGSIALGSSSLSLETCARLENQDFDRLFAANCTLTFEGCNVAEEARGEYFLVEVAKTLLVRNGGKARGNTVSGFGHYGSNPDSSHPFGTWVTANLGAGGTLRLENGTHLHRDNIRNRGDAAASRAADFERRGWLKPGVRTEIDLAVQQARNWMATDGFEQRYNACKWLNFVDFKFAEADNAVFHEPGWR